jgi:hypothetical protein
LQFTTYSGINKSGKTFTRLIVIYINLLHLISGLILPDVNNLIAASLDEAVLLLYNNVSFRNKLSDRRLAVQCSPY